MIVEHTFVTTLDPDEAFRLAEELLAPLRFRLEAGSDRARAWRRGAESHRKSRGRLSDVPTRVRMTFDRGRVVVASALEVPDRPRRLPQLLAVGVTLALERSLALGEPPDDARVDCDTYDRRMTRRDRWRTAFYIGVLGLAVAGITALIAINAG